MRPWEQTAALCGMRWIPPFVIHNAGDLDAATLAEEGQRYRRWLEAEAAASIRGRR
jgi:glutathione-regulated potassium-efflux system ancillary protein KefF